MSGFGDRREWAYCVFCQENEPTGAFAGCVDDEMNCTECGQPPRCRAGRETVSRCDRQADPGSRYLGFCSGHINGLDLNFDEEEAEFAIRQIAALKKAASFMANGFLDEALELAENYLTLKYEALQDECAALWEQE